MRTAKKITRSLPQGKIASGETLTPRQRESISAFMKGKIRRKDQRALAKGFKDSVKLTAAELKLHDPDLKPSQKSLTEKRIRRLNNQITPAAKRAAIESNRPFIKAALQEIRRDGNPDNTREFIEKLGPGVRARTYGLGGTGIRGDRSMRELLRKTFDIEGKPGRKPGRKPR
jgi:hypothetical protein